MIFSCYTRLIENFREDVAVTAQTMQIRNRPCRIYGEAHAEYLLLQMTGEHELQSMDDEVAAIAQSTHQFLFAAIPVENWNDCTFSLGSPCCVGKARVRRQGCGYPALSDGAGHSHTEAAASSPGKCQIILGGYSLAGLFALWASTQTNLFYGIAAAPPRCGFRAGWSLNSSTRYRHSTFI